MASSPSAERVGTPDAAGAGVWLWLGRALFVGAAMPLDTHSGAVSCLVVGVDAPFTVYRAGSGTGPVRTALVAPRVAHRVEAHGRRMAFLYLDPGSADDRACRALFTAGDAHVALAHRAENAVVDGAGRLGPASDVRAVTAWVADAVGGHPADGPRPPADPRITVATQRLLAVGEPVPAAVLAAEVGLSESRFLHLFRRHTGTSFRRFRLWAQMHRAGRALAAGADMTRAAADAGFASPSHFSTAFHAMFGMPPSHLRGARPTVTCIDP